MGGVITSAPRVLARIFHEKPIGGLVGVHPCGGGVRGVRLEAVTIGGTTYTSREAIQRFSERLSGANAAPQLVNPASRTRQRQLEQTHWSVSKELGLDSESSLGNGCSMLLPLSK